MIRSHRLSATAQDDASPISGWNISPNLSYTVAIMPDEASCAVLLMGDSGVLVASGAALTGADQPCVLIPQPGQSIGMVDAELGWHLLLTTAGTDGQREIRFSPQVDLPDEIHPVYGDDDIGLARATVAIDDAAHYRDDVGVTCQLGLGAGLGDVVSVPVDDVAVVGQVESITWTATPDGHTEQAVIRRHVAIAPEPYVQPDLPTVTDYTAITDAITATGGDVLADDTEGLSVIAVNGLPANVGVGVVGSNGGIFTVASDGVWSFDPAGTFDDLEGGSLLDTSVLYNVVNSAGVEAWANITVTVEGIITGPALVASSFVVASAFNSAQTLTLPEGIEPGDLVVIANACCGDNSNRDLYVTGYTEVADLFVYESVSTQMGVFYKVMGDPVDTQAIGNGIFQSGYYRMVYQIMVFRGVDPITPLDVAHTIASGQNSPTPNPPAITPVTDGALVVSVVASGLAAATGALPEMTVSCPNGFDLINWSGSKHTSATIGVGIGAASKEWADGDGPIDPGTWAGIISTNNSYSSWLAVTLALKSA